MAANRYIVPDPKGDRGPYSSDEIRTFVDAGTLRPTTRIRHAAGARMVTAQQVVDGHATFAALAAGTEEIEPETLPPVAPVARARPRPATANRTRTGPVSRPSTGSMGRPGTGAVGRTTRSAPRGEATAARGTGRVTRRSAGGGNGRILIAVLGVVAVIAVAVVIAFATR